jgi:hypothetical protein
VKKGKKINSIKVEKFLMKKIIKLILVFVCILLVLGFGIYWMFFDIQRIDGQQEIGSYTSPKGTYTVTAYLNDSGATTDYAVLCSAENKDDGKKKNIYWQRDCNYADIVWIDDDTVNINGVELNVKNDTYDYRR